MNHTENIATDATATIGSQGIVLSYDTHELVVAKAAT